MSNPFLAMPDRAAPTDDSWSQIEKRLFGPRCPIHWSEHIQCGPFCEARIIREPAPALLFDPTSETWSQH